MAVIARPTSEARRARALAWLGAAPIVVGVTVLVGWVTDVSVLRDAGGGTPMKPNTAVCLVLLGAATRSDGTSGRRRAVLCAAVAAIASLTLVEYGIGADLGIDELLFDERSQGSLPSPPGRMAAVTGLALLLLAIGVPLVRGRGRSVVVGQSFAVGSFAIAVAVGLAHSYGIPASNGPGLNLTNMAPATAVVVTLLALAVALTRPDAGLVAPLAASGPISRLGRRLLVASIAAPAVLGWVRVVAQRSGLVGTEEGTAAFALTNIAIFATLAWVTTASLRRVEGARTAALGDLAASQHQLQDFLDRAPAVIFAKDLGGRYTLANHGLESIFGVPRMAIIGRTDHDFVPAELIPELLANDRRIVAGGRAIEEEEVGIGPGGEQRLYLSTKFPLLGPDGVVYGVGGIATDITDRRAMELERDALAERVRQAERLEALGQLAGGIAHDFNNLLAVIVTYATFVERQVGDVAAAADVAAIRQAAERGAALTRQLVSFSRSDPVIHAPSDLGAVVMSVSEMMARTLSATIELSTEIAPGLPLVACDPGQVEQVLVNLIVNARDAMPSGGRLRVGVSLDGEAPDLVRLTVSDNGIGMSPGVRDRVFEPFFTTKPRGRGTGLGLSTVHGIVRQVGGRVDLRSTPGEGTTVDVLLPAAATVPPSMPGLAPARFAPGRAVASRRIVLVEDDPMLRAALTRVLREKSYLVAAFESAEHALRDPQTADAPDLLVTDVVLPGQSGPRLARRLRTRSDRLAVLFLTANRTEELDAVHLDASTDLLEKPFSSDAFLEAVSLLLEEAWIDHRPSSRGASPG